MTADFEHFLKWGDRMLRFYSSSHTKEDLRSELRALLNDLVPTYEGGLVSKREHFSRFIELFMRWLCWDRYVEHEWLERELYGLLMEEEQTYERWNKYSLIIHLAGTTRDDIKAWLTRILNLSAELGQTELAGHVGTLFSYKMQDGRTVGLYIGERKDGWLYAKVDFQNQILIFESEDPAKSLWIECSVPWPSDVEFARAAYRDLRCQVRCNPGILRAKESLDITEVWQINVNGEGMVHKNCP